MPLDSDNTFRIIAGKGAIGFPVALLLCGCRPRLRLAKTQTAHNLNLLAPSVHAGGLSCRPGLSQQPLLRASWNRRGPPLEIIFPKIVRGGGKSLTEVGNVIKSGLKHVACGLLVWRAADVERL